LTSLGILAFELLLELKHIRMSTTPHQEFMAQEVNPSKAFGNRLLDVHKVALWGAVLVGVLLSALYFRVLGRLVTEWWRDPDTSHGFLVPPFAAYLAWTNRERIRAAKIQPSWAGVAVIAFGLAMLILGEYGAELFVSRVSLVVVMAGLTLCFGGSHLLKELRFSLLVLLLAIPLPAIIYNQVTFPLQILASKLASDLLPLFHVPVLREGNVIVLPTMRLEVAEACSGIRSLISLFTLAIFYGYFLEKSVWRRTFLALSSIPIAIGANAVRILGTGLCVQYWDPDKAMGFFHEFSGWVVFVVSLSCLFAVHKLLTLFSPKRVIA
jgi:exosortase